MHGPSIVLVERHEDLRVIACEVLRAAGFEVLCLARGEDVRPAIRSAPAPPRLLLLDPDPERMDARVLVSLVRAEPLLAKLPVLVLTTDGRQDTELALFPFVYHLQKPFDGTALLARVREIFTGKAARR